MARLLSTSEFAEALGISESSVRRLADSGEIEVQRSTGGHRKIPIAEAIRYARKTKARISRPDLLEIATTSNTKAVTANSQSWSDKLLTALMKGNYDSVIGLMQAMYLDGFSIAEICDGPICDAWNAIGDNWPQDKRSIFLEHRATILFVRAFCQIRLSLPEIDKSSLTAIGGAPQDDPYLLPSLMAS